MQANILPSTFSAGEPYVVPFSAPGSLSPISRTVSKLIGPALFATRRREFDSYRTVRPDRFLIAFPGAAMAARQLFGEKAFRPAGRGVQPFELKLGAARRSYGRGSSLACTRDGSFFRMKIVACGFSL